MKAPLLTHSHPQSAQPVPFSASQSAEARLRRAVEQGNRGNMRKCASILVSSDIGPVTPRRVDQLRAKNPAPLSQSQTPSCPTNAPHIFIDSKILAKNIRQHAKGKAAAGSGWTAELLLPLLDDAVCLTGIALLVQFICQRRRQVLSRVVVVTTERA